MPEAQVPDTMPRLTYQRGEPANLSVSGQDDAWVQIRDQETITRILDDLCGKAFVISGPGSGPGLYGVSWAGDDMELIDGAMVVDACTVVRGGWLYTAQEGEIDVAFLGSLLADPSAG